MDYLQKASKLFSSLQPVYTHPMAPLLVSQNWCTVCCHIGSRRSQLWAWLCCLKPETPRARANAPLLLYFSLLSTLIFRELIYTLYRGPTGYCTEWHRQTFQSGPLANGTTRILSSLGHPLKVTFYSSLVKTKSEVIQSQKNAHPNLWHTACTGSGHGTGAQKDSVDVWGSLGCDSGRCAKWLWKGWWARS